MSEALLDPKTFNVMCQECGQAVKNISEPMKRTLKSSGQIVRESKKAFMVYCRQCNANRQVVYAVNTTVCVTCSAEVKTTAPMKQALKEMAANKDKDE